MDALFEEPAEIALKAQISQQHEDLLEAFQSAYSKHPNDRTDGFMREFEQNHIFCKCLKLEDP